MNPALDFETFANAIPVAVFIKDSQSRFVFMNRACEELWGLTIADIVGTDGSRYFPQDQMERFLSSDREIFADRRGLSVEESFRNSHLNENRIGLTFKQPVYDSAGEPLYLIGVTIDISAGKQVEARLIESEQKLRGLFEMCPLGIAMTDMKGNFIDFNRAFEEITGYSRKELDRLDYWTLTPKEYAEAERQQLDALGRSKRYGPYQKEYIQKGGSRVPIRLNGVSVTGSDGAEYIWSLVEDIAEQKRAEEHEAKLSAQLEQAQRMEAIGHLTGGLAHDLNNLLTIILGNIEVIEDCTKDNAFVQAASKQAIEAAESGAELIRRLLAFARQQPLQPQQQELNSLVTNLTTLLARTLGEDINIILDLTPELWPVVIDPVQFQSALTNLANNARDAMSNGGRLTIMTSNVHLDGAFPVQTGEVVAGDYVQITVSDTGTGMTPDVASRAFEPFFTTKPIGKGTGLGLSMVFGFIKQSGGHITIDSTVGRGTSVRLHLPREVNPTTPASAAIDPGPTPRGCEILLVVEDSTQVRLMTARHLRSLGYTVIEAESGEAALAILDDKDSRIDLLFTDIVMSGKSDGRELAGVARQQRPGLKVLLTSGYSGESSAGDLDVRLLQKPFNRVALACAVRSALDERQHD